MVAMYHVYKCNASMSIDALPRDGRLLRKEEEISP